MKMPDTGSISVD